MMLYISLCTLFFTMVVSAPDTKLRWESLAPAQGVGNKAPSSFFPYEEAFASFKKVHGKTYETDKEEAYRYMVFRTNLMKIEFHNKLYAEGKKSFFLGVNQFTDMENWEFQKLNGFKKNLKKTSGCSKFLTPNNLAPLPDSVDWREKGYVTPVKNQGQCGSCWSFSTTGSLEGQHFRKTGQLISLSEQQLVDCSGKYGNQGCNGGLMDQAFAYIKDNGGIESENEYPYNATQGKCQFQSAEVVATDTGCVDVEKDSEKALQKAVATVGPVSVAIDASHPSFQSYSGGVYDEPACSSEQLDHGVLVVGYGTMDGQDYWIVKNSWSEKWGNQGYVYMSRNKGNQCGIASQASYPLV